MLQNATIGRKLAFGFGVVVLALMLIVVLSFTGVGSIVSNAKEVIYGNQLDSVMTQKEVDHLNWVSKVNQLLTDENVTSLEVQTDDHKCGFGDWLYSESRKEAEAAGACAYVPKRALQNDLLPQLTSILVDINGQ